MKCNLIRDLLPLYCDDLTSDDSREEIEKHLAECPECADIYEKMSAKEEITMTEKAKKIKPMKKLKKSFEIKLAISILATAAVLAGIFIFVFYGVVPINSNDLSWRVTVDEVSMYSENDSAAETENEDIHKMLRVHFKGSCQAFRTKSYDPELIYTEDAVIIDPVITFYPILRLPFDDTNPKYTLSLDITDNTDQTITIRCRDKTIELSVRELLEECEKK